MSPPASVDPQDPVALAKYYEDHSIPVEYNAGFIVLSVVVSLIGCYSALLMIGRRTSNRGWLNILYLILAATMVAAVGIWGMHFIGMHLKLKPSEDITWFVHFNPGFTVMSLFLPLVILCIAFYFLGSQSQVDYLRIFICGLAFGGIVGLMHYSASFQASFAVHYDIVNLVFSIVIACVASSGALLAFFRWRERWQDVWWKRLLCGLILATAVCAMHYVALVGTSWSVKQGHYSDDWQNDRNAVLAYAIAGMCVALCLVAAGLAIYDVVARKMGRLGDQQLVVASASFTRDGKILVKPDGSIPMQTMSTRASMREIMRELHISSSTFQWLYQLTWNWGLLEPFMPRIAARILGLQALAGVESSGVDSVKEAFILASQGLASELYLPMTHLGVLFDKTLTTGGQTEPSHGSEKKRGSSRSVREDRSSTTSMVEAGLRRTPAGVMLILVRELPSEGSDSAARYLSKGFRLSEPRFLVPVLSDRLSVDRDLMGETLEQLQSYARRGIRSVVQPNGVYATLFALRQREAMNEVLVYNFARHQVPAFRLPNVHRMTDSIRDWLKNCQNMNLEQVIGFAEDSARLLNPSADPSFAELATFQHGLVSACEAILDATKIWPNIGLEAKVSCEVVDVPSSEDAEGCAHMVMFNVLLPEPLMPHERNLEAMHLPHTHGPVVSIADSIKSKERPFVFTPLSFFQTAQSMLFQGPSSKSFALQAVHQLNAWYPTAYNNTEIASHANKSEMMLEDEKRDESPLSSPPDEKPTFVNPFNKDDNKSHMDCPPADDLQAQARLSALASARDMSSVAEPAATVTRSERSESNATLVDMPAAAAAPAPARPAKSPRRSQSVHMRRAPPPAFDPAQTEGDDGQGEVEGMPQAPPRAYVSRVAVPSVPPTDQAGEQHQERPSTQESATSFGPDHGTGHGQGLGHGHGGTSRLTPREQARLVNLQQAMLARQQNDGWAARALSELPSSASVGGLEQHQAINTSRHSLR